MLVDASFYWQFIMISTIDGNLDVDVVFSLLNMVLEIQR